jgi:hypothetical protein
LALLFRKRQWKASLTLSLAALVSFFVAAQKRLLVQFFPASLGGLALARQAKSRLKLVSRFWSVPRLVLIYFHQKLSGNIAKQPWPHLLLVALWAEPLVVCLGRAPPRQRLAKRKMNSFVSLFRSLPNSAQQPHRRPHSPLPELAQHNHRLLA